MADKLALPKAKFTHDLVAAPVDAAMKAAEATSAKLYRIPVAKIMPIPGFNVRVQSPDYLAHVERIRADIAQHGYNSTKPLAGFVAKNGDESVIYVTDGHTRLAAVNAYNADPDLAEKDEITVLPVLVQPKEVSLTDLTVQLHTANNGRPLTPFEMGIIVKRLLAEDGAKKADIATRLGVTSRYLDDVLLLANAGGAVKQHVASGAVSSTMAIQLLRKDSDTAAEKIEAAVAKTAGTGKKATKKHADSIKMLKTKLSVPFNAGDDMKEIVKAVAAQVRATVEAEEGEEDSKLSTVTGTIDLVISTPAPTKAPKAKAKPAAKTKAAPAVKAEPAEEPAEKPAKKAKAKPAAEPEPAPKKKAKAKTKAAIPVEGAEAVGEDDEPAILPPKVKSDDIDEEVDI